MSFGIPAPRPDAETGIHGQIAHGRMRCLEFLYFYLLPEQTAPSDDPSLRSASGSSSTATSSEPYPPSPISTSTRIDDSRELLSRSPVVITGIGMDDPASAFLAASRMSSQSAFIPQTPKKKSQPSLGFATPSARSHLRQASGSALSGLGHAHTPGGKSDGSRRSITPTLETVPPSPEVFVQARQAEGNNDRKAELGTPMKRGGSTTATPRKSSGLQRSSTMLDLAAPAHTSNEGERRVTAIHQKRPSDVVKPATPARRSMPPPASPAKFLQASDAPPVPSTPRRSSGDSASTPRRSSTTLALDQAARVPTQRPPTSSAVMKDGFKVPSTPTSTPAGLPPVSGVGTPKSSKAPRTRHSLAPSHTYTSLATAGMGAPPLPASSRTPASSRMGTRGSDTDGGAKTPSKMKRSETSGGLPPVPRVPPSPSMGMLGPGKVMPLRDSRRVVSRGNSGAEDDSISRDRERGRGMEKGVKSVQEKKELVRPPCNILVTGDTREWFK